MTIIELCLLGYFSIGIGFATWLWVASQCLDEHLRLDLLGFALVTVFWSLLAACWIYEELS